MFKNRNHLMSWLLSFLLCFSSSFSVITANEETVTEEEPDIKEVVLEDQPETEENVEISEETSVNNEEVDVLEEISAEESEEEKTDTEVVEENLDNHEEERDLPAEGGEALPDETDNSMEPDDAEENGYAEAEVFDGDNTGEILAEGTCGNLTWTLMKDGRMKFLGEGAMPDYSDKNPAPWAAYRNNILSLEFYPYITKVGDYAFYNCSKLWDPNLQSAIDLESVGDYAFYGCQKLQRVEFSENLQTIGDHAFENCEILSSVKIISGKLSSIGSSAFNGCDNIEEFYVSENNTEFQTIDGWLCKGTELIYCPPKLKKGKVTVPEGITTTQFDVFYGSSELTKLTLPESFIWYDFVKLGFGESAGPVGSGCDIEFKGTSDSIPEEWFFQYNEQYGNFGDHSLDDICWTGTKLIIPEGVKTIGACAMDRSELEQVTIPSTVTSISLDISESGYCTDAFGGELTTINVSKDNSYYTSIDGALLSKDQKTFLYCPRGISGDFVIPDGVQTVAKDAFASAYLLDSVVIPEGVTTIEEGAFYDADLEEVRLPSTITTIGYCAFGSYNNDYSGVKVYYNGTRADAKKIDIGLWNEFSEWVYLGGEGDVDYGYFISFEMNNDNATGYMDSVFGYLSDEENLPANGFSCSGMAFTGWNTKPDGSGYSYADKESIRNIVKNVADDEFEFDSAFITLYAQWKTAKKTYPVVYELDGGTDGPAIQYKVHGETLILSTVQPKKEGYDFKGWATTLVNARKGTVKYKAGATVKYKENKRLTLFAVWKEKTYKVTYNANGGKNAPAAQTKYYTKQLTLSKKQPTRTGYVFVGWEDREHGEGGTYNTVYQSGASYTANYSVTLYAVWSPIYYTVQFVGNGADNTMESVTLTYGTSLQLVNTFTRTGYTLNSKKAWKCSNKKTYADGTTVKNLTTKNGAVVKMTAQWTPNTYVVRFNRGSTPISEVKGKQMPDKKYTYDKSITLPAITYTAAGYELDHWNAQNGKQYTDKQKNVKNIVPSGEVTLTAVWREKEYKIDYKLNGGENPEGVKTSLTITSDDYVLPAPTKTGYKFAGWYTNKDFKNTTKIEMIPGGSTKAYTVYAKWNPIHYSLQYAPGAEDVVGTMANKENIAYGTTFKLAENKYTREGYTFDGWTYEGYDGKPLKSGKSVSKLTAEDGGTVMMTAVWKPVEVTLKLNSNYPDGSTNKTITKKLTIEDTLPGKVDDFENKGTIVSWYTKEKEKVTTYNVGEPVSNITKKSGKTFTLYAKWIQGAKPTVFYSNYDAGFNDHCVLNTYSMAIEAVADRATIESKDIGEGRKFSNVRDYFARSTEPCYWWSYENGIIQPRDTMLSFFGCKQEKKLSFGQIDENAIKRAFQEEENSSFIGVLTWYSDYNRTRTHEVMVYLNGDGQVMIFDPGLKPKYATKEEGGIPYEADIICDSRKPDDIRVHWPGIDLQEFYIIKKQ